MNSTVGSEPAAGYYLIQSDRPNPFEGASLAEIVQQLESCGYRCEAGQLQYNLAFIELKKRAESETFQAKLNEG